MIEFAVRKPDKKRFLDAIRLRESEQVCFNELEFAPNIVEAILGKPVRCRSYDIPPADHVRFVRCVGMDMCNMVAHWWLGRTPYTDATGLTQYTTGNLSLDDGPARLWPDPEFDADARRIEELLPLLDGTRIGWTLHLPSAGALVISAMGFERYYLSVYDEPQRVKDLHRRIEEVTFPAIQRFLGEYKPDAVRTGAFLCDKNGLLMRPEMTEQFVLEPLKRHLEVVRRFDTPAIIHSDGDLSQVMGCLVDLGVAMIHPHENCPNFDIYETKKRWGDRIALSGNIDVYDYLVNGTPESVRAETLMHLEPLSAGGGYVCGSSHDVSNEVRIENLRAMAETIATYTRPTG